MSGESGPRYPRPKTVGRNPAEEPVMVASSQRLLDEDAIEDLVEELPDRAMSLNGEEEPVIIEQLPLKPGIDTESAGSYSFNKRTAPGGIIDKINLARVEVAKAAWEARRKKRDDAAIAEAARLMDEEKRKRTRTQDFTDEELKAALEGQVNPHESDNKE